MGQAQNKSADTTKVLSAVVKTLAKTTSVLQEITEQLPMYYQYDLINDTELSDDASDSFDDELEYYEDLRADASKSSEVH